MQKLIIVLGFVLLTAAATAQNQALGTSYKSAVGLKVYPAAISVKTFQQYNKALEGLLYFWEDGVRFTGLYEIHGDINGAPGLKWYLGPGGHIGFWTQKWKDKYPERDDGVMIGIDGIIGLDYKIKGAPINVCLDWQPSFNFIGYNYFEGGWGGIGIRYAF